jgi:thiamine-phosphate pyrophosphorylase
MKLVVITPEALDSREPVLLAGLFAVGLERCHVRKPAASRDELAAWLRAMPPEFRSRLVLHQHHELVDELGLGGRHWRDDASAPAVPSASATLASRSCHGIATMRAALGHYDSVFVGPVFPSISKPGHGPRGDFDPGELTAILSRRSPDERRTSVLALGGITPGNALRCHELGFDGVAVLGAVWQAADPVHVFGQLQTALHHHAA